MKCISEEREIHIYLWVRLNAIAYFFLYMIMNVSLYLILRTLIHNILYCDVNFTAYNTFYYSATECWYIEISEDNYSNYPSFYKFGSNWNACCPDECINIFFVFSLLV